MTKFRYGQKVKVVDGFFKNITGTVIQYQSIPFEGEYYLVRMQSIANNDSKELLEEQIHVDNLKYLQ